MKKIWLLLPVALSANTLNLNNDSSSTLTAKIISSQLTNNLTLDTLTIGPQTQTQWEDLYGGQIQGVATSPYTIEWICPSGKVYGVSYEVPAGATTSAQGSNGDRQCQTISPNYNP